MKGNYDSMTCGCKDADNMRKAHAAKYSHFKARNIVNETTNMK